MDLENVRMDRKTRHLPALALIALLLLSSGAVAGPLSSYNYNATPNPVLGVISSDNTKSSIHLSNEPSVLASGSTDILLANLTTASSANVATPDVFTQQPWKIDVSVFDIDSKTTGVVHFSGTFSGTVWSGGAKITNSFTGLTTQFLHLGNNWYTITEDSYTKPGGPNATRSGALGASIVLSDVRPEGFQSPEPATLLLAGLAAGGGGLLVWRRRKAVAAE
jgi:hypothetical protein